MKRTTGLTHLRAFTLRNRAAFIVPGCMCLMFLSVFLHDRSRWNAPGAAEDRKNAYEAAREVYGKCNVSRPQEEVRACAVFFRDRISGELVLVVRQHKPEWRGDEFKAAAVQLNFVYVLESQGYSAEVRKLSSGHIAPGSVVGPADQGYSVLATAWARNLAEK